MTAFTRSSVHCADRMVATSSSNALRWRSGHGVSGYARRNAARIASARACSCVRVSAITESWPTNRPSRRQRANLRLGYITTAARQELSYFGLRFSDGLVDPGEHRPQ